VKSSVEPATVSEAIIKRQSRRFPLFGREAEITLYDIDEMFAEEMFLEVYKEGLRLQKIFNFYDPESELSLLNKKRKMAVSGELKFVIKNALDFSEMTKGAYDISKGKQFLERKSGKEISEVSCSYKDISVQENIVSLNNPDAMIDLGSIAKGFIADMMIELMQKLGIESGFVDARGDMRIYGKYKETCTIQHPRKNETFSPINFENMAIATSGDYSQYDKSYDKSHILGKKEFISVTVIADSLMRADAIATSVSVLDKKNAAQFLKNNKDTMCFAVDSALVKYYFNGFEKILIKQNEQGC
jgi:FAD:protein FMN transferase